MNIFGMQIKEDEENELQCLLETVDPLYWKAIVIGIRFLQQDTDAPLDLLFTAVYAVVMQMEDVMNKRLSCYQQNKINFNNLDITAKD